MSDRMVTLQSPFARLMSGTARVTLTLAIVGLAAGLTIGGRAVLADRVAEIEQPDAAPVTPVQTARIEILSGHVVERRFAGQVEARQEIALGFERAGTLIEVTVREGDRVSSGDVVARLDTRLLAAERARLEAQRRAIEAQTEQARRLNARQTELRARGHASAQTVDDTSLALIRLEANLAEIDAALDTVDVNLSKSDLSVPFDGVVGDRTLDPGAVVSPGQAVLSLLDAASPRFRVGLDPDMAASLAIGDAMTVEIGGELRDGRVAQIAPDLDPATRNRVVFLDLAGPAPASGLTGEALVATEVPGRGAWVPVSALRQGPKGTWTLVTVVDDAAQIEAAEILHLQDERAFVRGTFTDGATFVPSGTHRLVPGQRLAPLSEEEQISWAR